MRQHPIVGQLSRRRLRPHANLDQAAFVSKRLPVADAGTIDWNDLDSYMGHRIATIISCYCFGRRFYPLDQLRLRDLHLPGFDGHIDFRATDEESGGHVACRSGDADENEQQCTQDARFRKFARACPENHRSNRSPNEEVASNRLRAHPVSRNSLTSGGANMRLRRASKLIFPGPKIKTISEAIRKV